MKKISPSPTLEKFINNFMIPSKISLFQQTESKISKNWRIFRLKLKVSIELHFKSQMEVREIWKEASLFS
jgi:hypothetical protein